MHKARLLGLGLGLVLSSGCMHPRVIVLSPTTPEGVRVTGIGKVSAPPDIARTNVGVEVRAETPEAASTEASQRMAAVVAALKQTGIAEKDLRTHSYAVAYEQEPVTPQPQAQGAKREAAAAHGVYRVSNMVEVTVRDLANVGKVLKAATDAGANNQWGVTFELENDAPLLTKARAMAVQDAQRSAAELAQLSGVKLGEIVSVTENEPSGDEAGPQSYALRAAEVPETPVEHGEITIHYLVQLVYATVKD